jgi:hypothetical protein
MPASGAPSRLQKPKVPDDVKAEVTAKADGLVEQFLKPNFIKKPPKKPRWNYIIAIHTKWHHSFFYFVATFGSPGPTAIKPTFEAPFTRWEYVGHRRCNMAHVRHTGQWWEIHKDLSPDECLESDDQLTSWNELALKFVKALPAK